ncbi:MAG: hypothetical protein ACRECX_02635 [Methyloceanibacter sp.]|uniref:hypothetical protein n=1 Tax=Methyloceanibacter sp. TaxID=1965321 RepID=UPI003D6C7D27
MPKHSPRTLVTFLLDRTGSMEPIRDDTIGAFNAYLDGLQKDGAAIDFTFLQFDSMSIDKICVQVPVREVKRLTRETYEPRASTPLIDAAYKTIKAVEESLKDSSETKAVICFHTDGQENSSTEYRWDELNALIKEKAKLGWQFNFMGVGIDAYEQGARMGIAPQATVAYDHQDPAATRAAFVGSADSARRYATGAAPTTAYAPAEKAAAGDRFGGVVQKAKRVLKKAIVDDIKL